MIILGVMMFLAACLMSFTLVGFKTTESYELSTKVYYLAEAGLSEAIFKLKNDATWQSAFETMPTEEDPYCSGWSIAPYARSSALGDDNIYEITVDNLGCAQAAITVLAKINSGEGVARKVVKANVFKAIGSPISQYNIFTGGASENLEISATNPLRVHNGSLFSNSILKVKDGSLVQVDGKALAHGNILLLSGGQIQGPSCGSNICEDGCDVSTECPPADVALPPLDLNSSSPASYISRAQNSNCSSVRSDGKISCLFTSAEFEQMLWQHYPQLSLPVNAVVYITGDVNIRAGQELTVNGVLAAGRDINLGASLCWARSEFPYVRCGSSRVTVLRPGVPEDNLPSGLLAYRKINASSWLGFGSSALNVNGLVYSGDETKLSSVAAPIVIQGGVVVKKLTLSSLWNGIDIYLDSDVIVDTFGNPQYSPLITIDHWEEKY